MDEVLQRYKQGKFQKCLELIKLLPKNENIVQSFANENCLLICSSFICISKKNIDEMSKMQVGLYLFFDKVTSMEMTKCIPFELKLTALYNFVFWLLFYNDSQVDEMEVEEYLELIHKGLLKVLGKKKLSEYSNISDKIIDNLFSLKNLIYDQNSKVVLLILEFVILVLLYVLKTKKTSFGKCTKLVSEFVEEFKKIVNSETSVNIFSEEKSVPLVLFKFGLDKTSTLLSDLSIDVLDYLYILDATLFFLVGDYKKSLKSLQKNKNLNMKSLSYYLGIINSYKLENWDLCLFLLTKVSSLVIQANLKARYHIMHGKLYWIKRNHKEALQHFETALRFSPNCPVIYYYIGQEYGKMGIYDLMIENFEKLVKAVKHNVPRNKLNLDFEIIILNWIHPSDEITEIEALYALSVSYGLNEKFHKASEFFEKILQLPDIDKRNPEKSIVQVPNFLTILHEASIINLLAGNLVRAEQIALDAAERFVPQESPKKLQETSALLRRDVHWLQMVIQQELLENDFQPKELDSEILFSEDAIFCFPQNIMALLIISEIQRIQGIEDYKVTLSKILSLFSSYLAAMYKKENISEEEKYVWTLIKALAGKTCLRIAMVHKNELSVEKMFKRALSCNKGDKDALYNYYMFLLKVGKSREALKLWNTFYKEETTISIDQVQSFALRYFLVPQITKRELEKIQSEIEFMNVKLR